MNYPMIGDPELKVAKLYDMLPAVAGTTSEGRTAANNAMIAMPEADRFLKHYNC